MPIQRHHDRAQVGENFTVFLDMADFAPENIKVSLMANERTVTVTARRQCRENEPGCEFVREVTHSYAIPEDVDAGKVASTLETNGMLRISAPRLYCRLNSRKKEKPAEIPVEKEKAAIPTDCRRAHFDDIKQAA